MTFEKRAARLAQLFAQGDEQERDERRAEWRALFSGVLDEHAALAGDMDGAIHRVISERYAHLDEAERLQLARELALVFRHWEEVDLNEIRQDRRNLIPPILRDA